MPSQDEPIDTAASDIRKAAEQQGAEVLAIGPGHFGGVPDERLRTVLCRRRNGEYVEYVTWRYSLDSPGFFSGRYFANVIEAVDDFRNLCHLEDSHGH